MRYEGDDMTDVNDASINESWTVLRDAYVKHLKDCVIKKMMEDASLSFEDACDICMEELDEDLHYTIPYDFSYDDVEDTLNELGYVPDEDEDGE